MDEEKGETKIWWACQVTSDDKSKPRIGYIFNERNFAITSWQLVQKRQMNWIAYGVMRYINWISFQLNNNAFT